MSWQRLKRWILPTPGGQVSQSVAPGLYHYQRETIDGFIRYHLRVDPDGQGVLIAAASEAVRLSPAGAAVAKRLLDGHVVDEIASDLAMPGHDISQLKLTIDQLGQPSGRYPIFNLTDPVALDRPSCLMAPFQADVVPGECQVMRRILERLWAAGIPHVRFVAADSIQFPVLTDNVRLAEDIGMIAGVRAELGTLASGDTLVKLSDVGLDYLVVPWGVTRTLHERIYGGGEYEQLGDVLREIRRLEMCPVVEIPLFRQTEDVLEDNQDRLAIWDVENVEVFAASTRRPEPGTAEGELTAYAAHELRQIAAWIEDLAAENPWQVIWLPPVEVAEGASVAQTVRRGPRAGGDVTIRVEADGQVLPPRGPRQVAGNILQQAWGTIWRREVFRRYRQRIEQVTRCDQCPGLAICASDCPADPVSWASD
jgi:radical SAM protein with 4Fe4S-binding SPASM domain